MIGLVAVSVLSASMSFGTAGEITARGSDSTLPLVKALAEAYTKATGTTIKLEGGGSGKGVEACTKGEVDFCFISRDLKDAEKQAGLTGVPYAFDGVVVIVHPSNPTTDVTVDQLRDIFTGTTSAWPDGKPVVAFNRNENSGTREVFQHAVMKDAKFTDKAQVKHDGVIISTVAKIATSVAFTSLGEMNDTVKAVKVNGVEATPANLQNKTYPLARTLNFATKGEAKPEVKAFIDWVAGKEGQEAVAKAHYTPVGESKTAAVGEK